MGSDTAVVTQKIFQLIGLTNAVSICFLLLLHLCVLLKIFSVVSFMTLSKYTSCIYIYIERESKLYNHFNF